MTKPYIASLVNALTLIVFGIWGYFASTTPSFTAFIPVTFGILLLMVNRGLKKENKAIAHIAVLLTLLVFIGLFKPLVGSIDRTDNTAIIRVIVMMLTSLNALATFIKSFIDARKNS